MVTLMLRCSDDLEWIKAGGKNINDIQYADDTALIKTSQAQLQKLVTEVEQESKKLAMALNEDKTECMVVTKERFI